MADAAYHRAWRAAHPEYRARQNQLRNERRRRTGRGDRSAEYARRRSRAIPPMPGLHVGHELFERARQVLGPRRTTLVSLHDPLYDDLLSEATLALIEGRNPSDAIRAYGARERAFGRVTCPLLEETARGAEPRTERPPVRLDSRTRKARGVQACRGLPRASSVDTAA